MDTYREPARDIPVIARADVVVAGSGPAGVSAAIAAAREGASVVLVEQMGNVGGIATEGLMSHWTGETKGGFYEEKNVGGTVGFRDAGVIGYRLRQQPGGRERRF